MVNSEKKYTGRIVAIVSVLVGLIGALAPVVADMDLSSTAGIVAGLVAVSTVVVKYLDGWQRYEERLDTADAAPAVPHEAAGGSTPNAHLGVLTVVPDEDEDPEEEIADVADAPDDDEIDAITDELVLSDVLLDEDERRAA
jgi:hypothetical protein